MKLSSKIQSILVAHGYEYNGLTSCYEKGNMGVDYQPQYRGFAIWNLYSQSIMAIINEIEDDAHHLCVLKVFKVLPESSSFMSAKQEYNARIDAENKLYHNEQAI